MSAAVQIPAWEVDTLEAAWQAWGRQERRPAIRAEAAAQRKLERPPANMAFYRRHTESLLRRYLYASMQVGRAPSILSDPVGRGWASSRPVRTFEDAVIFVLDIERCLEKLESFDRELLSRVVLQEYTQAEAAVLLGMSVRTISNRFPLALDRLTEKVLEAGLLLLPET
jgi:DNA-directed RNA polymerase specialized sigma24 family protein